MFEKRVRPQDLERVMSHPKLKTRLFVLNVIIFAFFTAPVVYAAIIASGVVSGEGAPDLGVSIWWILAAVSIMEIPALFATGFLMLSQAESATTFGAAFQKCQTALIVTLALGESVCVYGVVAAILGGPSMIPYAFLAFGVILMGISLIVFRPKAIAIVVRKLLEAEKGTK